MLEEEIEKIMKLLIIKLDNLDKWGGAHTELRNLKKGLPITLTQTKHAQKAVDKAIKILINRQILLAKKSTNEIHISLNPRKAKEIHHFLLGK